MFRLVVIIVCCGCDWICCVCICCECRAVIWIDCCVEDNYESLSKLYDALGRRQTSVLKLEEKLISECSHQIAIDGHVIGCKSTENDLAEKGYKFKKLGGAQLNLLMAYDVNTHIPLMSRIYEGAGNDKVSVRDFLDQMELKDMFFLVDRGFYSTENINIFIRSRIQG